MSDIPLILILPVAPGDHGKLRWQNSNVRRHGLRPWGGFRAFHVQCMISGPQPILPCSLTDC